MFKARGVFLVIDKTFIILPGVNNKKEKTLWQSGITDWDAFLNSKSIPLISPQLKDEFDSILLKAKKHLEIRNHEFFYYNIPRSDHWRAYKHFKDDSVFLDIETTGLSKDFNEITAVSFFNKGKVKTLINGIDLTKEAVVSELSKYKAIVSFNGTLFDLPFMLRKYPELVKQNYLHIDLMYACRKVGLTGGLKKIEQNLNISRDTKGVNGFEAVRLWHEYKRGNIESLNKLVLYNQEDVINLEKVADYVYPLLKSNILS